MCGRYALALRPSEVRQQLQQSQMPVQEAPDDDAVGQSYNLAPGCHGLVYRADGSSQEHRPNQQGTTSDTTYKLQAMQWGLVPFWTKRNPDYGSRVKTINCRDDSLLEDRGMWTTMKKKKRCIIVAQGFYEWLKKNGGKEKVPYFTKRKDGQLMCLAGLWDCVQFEDSDKELFTYTIITTASNKQLRFLHDRMPVILDNGSDAIRTWLDPTLTDWSEHLQSLLKPYDGHLECYPVSKDVNKVGNNSPSFLVPIDSAENKNNIANFFGNQKKAAKSSTDKKAITNMEHEQNDAMTETDKIKMEKDVDETRETTNRIEGSENNAPLPVPQTDESEFGEKSKGVKRERDDDNHRGAMARTCPQEKRTKLTPTKDPSLQTTPAKKQGVRSATSNNSAAKTPKSDGSRKITSFFGNK